VLRALLWRFHNADGAGRCFPSYERIAVAAKCHRDSVCVALKALEDAGLLTWVHRLTRLRRREQDLFGHWGSMWQRHGRSAIVHCSAYRSGGTDGRWHSNRV
jgi:hypothetical protein